LACAKPNKAISALVKLEAGPAARTQAGMQAAIQHIQADDDDILQNISELLDSHPMVAKRVDEIRKFAGSQKYHILQAKMDQNLTA
jgi:Zn-dependent protease with chaperone function